MTGSGISAAAPVIAGLVLGISFVVLFSFFSANLEVYPKVSRLSEASPAGRLVFSSIANEGNAQLYVVNADGTGLTNLTSDRPWNFSPLASPDGRKIAYVSSNEHPGESISNLYVMNVNGTDKTRLTHDGFTPGARFAWSPDSTKIAYEASVKGQQEIFVVNIDGSNRTALTEGIKTYNARPMWSYNDTVVFEEVSFDKYNRPSAASLVSEKIDGRRDTMEIINYLNHTGNYVLSPDLNRVAFVQFKEITAQYGNDYMYSLHVMNIDGRNSRELAGGLRHLDLDIRWSPDSSHIAFQASKWEQATVRVYVADVNKNIARVLTNSDTNEWNPVWSSDGRIVFEKDVGRYFPEIYVADTHQNGLWQVAEIKYPLMSGPVDWLAE